MIFCECEQIYFTGIAPQIEHAHPEPNIFVSYRQLVIKSLMYYEVIANYLACDARLDCV
jgi:hypothetical protein